MDNNAKIISPETEIKWMCENIFITIDKRVINLKFNLLKQQLSGGSYGYYVSGKFRSLDWINKNSVLVLGQIEF